MAEFYEILVRLHIAGGAMGVVLLWIPLFSPKGGRLHRRMGWIYVTGMSLAVVTALIMCALLLWDPAAVKPRLLENPPDLVPRALANARQFGVFLGYLGIITWTSGWLGLRALRAKRDPLKMRTAGTAALCLATLAASATVFVLGVVTGQLLFILMSPIGLFAWSDFNRYMRRVPTEKMWWWYDHLSGMLGTGIAAYTAFLVFGSTRLLPDLARTAWYPLAWIIPGAVGTVATHMLVKHYRRKFTKPVEAVAEGVTAAQA